MLVVSPSMPLKETLEVIAVSIFSSTNVISAPGNACRGEKTCYYQLIFWLQVWAIVFVKAAHCNKQQ